MEKSGCRCAGGVSMRRFECGQLDEVHQLAKARQKVIFMTSKLIRDQHKLKWKVLAQLPSII